MSILDFTFYHGSEIPIKGNKIKANSINVGNRLENPSWSVYMWRNKEYAYSWALFHRMLAEMKSAEISRKDNPGILLDLYTDGFKIAIDPDFYGRIREITLGKKCYVYRIQANIQNVGLGQSESLPEFTSTKDCKIIKRETVTITPELFERKTYIASSSVMNELMHNFGASKDHRVLGLKRDLKSRGLATLLMYGDNQIFPVVKRVRKQLKNQTANVGDDIAIMVDNILKDLGKSNGFENFFHDDDLMEMALEDYMNLDDLLEYTDEASEPSLDNIKYIYAPHGPGEAEVPNSILEYKGKNYRVRVETLIYNDQGMLYIGKRTDTTNKDGVYYDIPGGSVEPGKDLEEQAIAECKEEVRAVIDNVEYSGKWYINKYDPNRLSQWKKDHLWPLGLKYDGAINFIFTGRFKKNYTGYIKKADRDEMFGRMDWEYPDDIPDFRDIHMDALKASKYYSID